MKNIPIKLKLFFLIPVILLLLMIRIFKDFRISKIISHKIGHLAIPMEIYVCEYKDNPNKTPIIWFFGNIVANQFLKKQWSKKLIIFPRYILEPIYILFRKYKFFSFFLEDFSKESEIVKRTLKDGVKQIDDKEVLLKHKPSIEFNDEEINIGESYLKSKGLQNKKLVLFSARTSKFHNEINESNRNSNINNQILGIKFLISKNYKTLKMGKNEEEKINLNDQNFIDYSTSKDQNDFLDVYLGSKCEFMISSESGINQLADIFRKPMLIIDHYYCSAYEKYASKAIILPKKFKNLKTEKFVNFVEAYKKLSKNGDPDDPSEVNRIGYEVIENNEFEIKEAIESMLYLINNGFGLDEILQKQKKFWKNLEKNLGYSPNNKVIICPNFYSKNIDLFDQ
jgi:putative glycosyltransferase (TIGR04372 family)